MSRKSSLILVLIIGLVLAACSADPTTSEDYQDLEQDLTAAQGQIDDLESQLASVTAERDELMAEPDVPAEVLAIPDEWLEANERGDGSVVDLYAPSGYHVYGDEKISRDELATHFGVAAGGDNVWITDPYVIANEGDGRYVIARGMRLDYGTGSYASVLSFEIEETAEGAPEIVHTQWMYVH
jgi:hypothetical protein